MRQSIILLIALIVAVVLYTAYGLMTFEPDPATPFTFAEPAPLADPAATTATATTTTGTPPADAQQTSAAMTQMTQAITLYQSYEKEATPQAISTFSILNAAVFNGRLPAYLISQSLNSAQVRNFDLITLDPKKFTAIRSGDASLNCGVGAATFDIMVGDNGDNRIQCDGGTSTRDQMFLGGPGNDDLISDRGNRIINAGTGDDKITAGPGRTIIILDDAWGKDTLMIDCTASKINLQAELPQNFPIPWVQPYTNFILLSPRINPNDVEWNGLVLTNKTTGDTLSVSEKCFNLVSAGQSSTQ